MLEPVSTTVVGGATVTVIAALKLVGAKFVLFKVAPFLLHHAWIVPKAMTFARFVKAMQNGNHSQARTELIKLGGGAILTSAFRNHMQKGFKIDTSELDKIADMLS